MSTSDQLQVVVLYIHVYIYVFKQHLTCKFDRVERGFLLFFPSFLYLYCPDFCHGLERYSIFLEYQLLLTFVIIVDIHYLVPSYRSIRNMPVCHRYVCLKWQYDILNWQDIKVFSLRGRETNHSKLFPPYCVIDLYLQSWHGIFDKPRILHKLYFTYAVTEVPRGRVH